MNSKLLAPLVILLILPSLASAADYYVDTDSTGGPCSDNSNPGTEALPWCTVRKGVAEAVAGDTVYIKKGTYTENDIDITKDGTTDDPIVIRNYPGDLPVIRGKFDWTDKTDCDQVCPSCHYSQCPGHDYITIDGLHVITISGSVMALQGDYNTIKNCILDGNRKGEPVLVYSGMHNKILHNKLFNSHWNCINVQNAEYTEMAYNDIYDCPLHGGFNIFSNTEVYYGKKQEHNSLHHNYVHNIDETSFYARTQKNMKIYNNIFIQNDTDWNEYNIIFDNQEVPEDCEDIEFFNNLIVGGKWSIGTYLFQAKNFTIKNNIMIPDPTNYYTNGYGGSLTGMGDSSNSISNNYEIVFDQAIYDSLKDADIDSIRNELGTALYDQINDMGENVHMHRVTDDYDGNPRPSSGPFDIGPFEFAEAQSCGTGGDCDDRECYTASCPAGECVYTVDDNDDCDDGLFCTGTESCSGGSCVSSGNPCTDGDSYACTSIQCDEGADSCGSIIYDHSACDDGISCTIDECIGSGVDGCSQTLDDASCPDDPDCTSATCTLTGCIYDPPGCDAPCPTSDASWQHTPISTQIDTFTAEFDATPDSASIDGLTTLSIAEGSAYGDYAVIIRFNVTGFIDARNGGDYAADSEITYVDGTEYHFRVEVNVPAHTYSVYVTPDGGSELTVGTDFAFRTEQQSITELNYWGLRSGQGSHEVCNFQIDTGQTYHRADNNPPNCIISLDELIAFMNRWKVSIADVPMPEMMDAIAKWKSGSACS